uniref:NADH dehydrogenase subunit 6 n=1 Tax=Platevindex mortoni TaxID=637517 RepID=D3YHP8_9EUPU|nr:NADH dehydrogenase subunit 6 [Platevindex mortoni]ADD37168.1 NADH dehydrogenase subunit 6 [Platevindex mortoni]UZH97740.1 NADH dehydrogenase subunit 6 [Platevindex mortoni]
MFELGYFFSFFVLCLMAMFPITGSPLSMGGALIATSFCLVSLMAIFSSSWYGYVLFLVYIGGLLVLFIYVCMVSSNFPFVLSPSLTFFVVGLAALAGLFMPSSLPKRVLGGSLYEAGGDLSLFLFVSLVVILLAAFLAVARIVSGGGSLAIESRK